MADTKLSALTELAATPASDDEVYIRDVSEAAAAESKRITVANLEGATTGVHGVGASTLASVANIATHAALTTGVHGVSTATVAGRTTGNYTGDDSANRAIAHGLGVVPSLVVIFETAGSGRYNLLVRGRANILGLYHAGAVASYAITAANTTNFYVGNAASYVNSGNNNGNTYYWVAFA